MQKVILALLVCAMLGYVAYQHRVQFKLVAPPGPGHPAAGTAAAHATAKPGGTPSPVRAQVEPMLKTLKVSSILLGEAPIVIINKQDYGVGDPLHVPGGKPVKVAAIDEGGITLTCEGETFHLDAPAAPDLAASRKKP